MAPNASGHSSKNGKRLPGLQKVTGNVPKTLKHSEPGTPQWLGTAHVEGYSELGHAGQMNFRATPF